MTAIRKLQPLSVEDYLAGELVSQVKHEYVGGEIYAMSGATNAHNIIAGNVFAALHAGLRGKPCRPFNSDAKIRIRLQLRWRFYYPDASVICRENPQQESFQDEPAVIVEVLSRKTRRIDEGEKQDAYFTIPSLSAYLLVEQDSPTVTVHRRTPNGFVREVHDGLDAVVLLAEIDAELRLAEIYDGVEFLPAAEDEEEPS
jgi:Uma2 family endonuclease